MTTLFEHMTEAAISYAEETGWHQAICLNCEASQWIDPESLCICYNCGAPMPHYEPPAVVYEAPLEVRAGSPLGIVRQATPTPDLIRLWGD